MTIVYLAIACGLLALAYGFLTSQQVLRASPGNEKMQDIAAAIQEGAKAYLGRQYMTIAVVGVIVAIILFFALGALPTLGFVIGAVLSGLAGFIGMNISVRANVRTAEAARHSLQAGLTLAFRSGAITGMLVAGLGLLSIAGIFGYLVEGAGLAPNARPVIETLTGLAFGASLISIFARLGGGIFTKAADVGADLVGKVEAGIPEDDPRNPAVIADNVGDNVGDCAGMAADLFETYVVTLGITMVTIALLMRGLAPEQLMQLMTLPLIVGGVCIITSIIGTYFVRLGKNQSIMGALYKGFWVTVILSIPAIIGVTHYTLGGLDTVIGGVGDPAAFLEGSTGLADQANTGLATGPSFTGWDLVICMMIGLAVTGLLVWITEYYTGTQYRPVRSIAKASETGHGTNVIQGLAISLEFDCAADFGDRGRSDRGLPDCRRDRCGVRGDFAARARGHGSRARRLRASDRQCRRHRRDGRARGRGSAQDRRARRSGQHHQGRDQGLCDRLGRARGARAVRCLYHRPP